MKVASLGIQQELAKTVKDGESTEINRFALSS